MGVPSRHPVVVVLGVYLEEWFYVRLGLAYPLAKLCIVLRAHRVDPNHIYIGELRY